MLGLLQTSRKALRSCSVNKGNLKLVPSCACHSNSDSSKNDLYKQLEVPCHASQKEIKSAYFKLAKKHHPDVNKNDSPNTLKFQEVSYAYEVLSDEIRRREYDKWGTTSEQLRRNGIRRDFKASTLRQKWKKDLSVFSKMLS